MLTFPRPALRFTSWLLLLAFLSSNIALANPDGGAAPADASMVKSVFLVADMEDGLTTLIRKRQVDHIELQFDLSERFENYKSGEACIYFHTDGKPCGIFFRAISRQPSMGSMNIAGQLEGMTFREWQISKTKLAKDTGELWEMKFGTKIARPGSAVIGGVASFALGFMLVKSLAHGKLGTFKAMKYPSKAANIWWAFHARALEAKNIMNLMGLVVAFGMDFAVVSSLGVLGMTGLDHWWFTDEQKQRANLDNLLNTAFFRATTGNDFGEETASGPLGKFDAEIAKELFAKEQAAEEAKKAGGKDAPNQEIPKKVQEALKELGPEAQAAAAAPVASHPEIITVGKILDQSDAEGMTYMREALSTFFTKYRLKHRDIYYKGAP